MPTCRWRYIGLLAGISLRGWNVWGEATPGETAQIMYNIARPLGT